MTGGGVGTEVDCWATASAGGLETNSVAANAETGNERAVVMRPGYGHKKHVAPEATPSGCFCDTEGRKCDNRLEVLRRRDSEPAQPTRMPSVATGCL